MDYNITIRPKDGKFQAIVSYKDLRGKWHQKSKQGPLTKRAAFFEEMRHIVGGDFDRPDSAGVIESMRHACGE